MGAPGKIDERGIIGRFYATFEAAQQATWLDRIGFRVQSDQELETYGWLGQVPRMREWVGPRLAKGIRGNTLTIRNKRWESTIVLPKEWIERDKTGQINMRIGDFTSEAAAHMVELASTLIANGTGSTNGLCYDGQYFFDTDHSEGASDTQLNLLTNSQVGKLDVASATAPTPFEAVEAVLGVIAYMLTYKDDQGRLMNRMARDFVVMVSPYLMAPFAAALSNMMVSAGSGAAVDNTILALNRSMGFNVNLIVNPQLTLTTQFAVFRTDQQAKPLIIQQESGPEVDVLGRGSDCEFNERVWKVGVQGSYNMGYGLWQYAALATMS